MCGICGKLQFDSAATVDSELLDRMMDQITHRGPDGRGKYASGPVGFGHTRLAIIDLNTGDQPISNEDGSIWIVYNGEIYNFQELRDAMMKKGHVFKTASDTEVIVHLYEEYGADCVTRLQGMFAFAIWDAKQRVLLLARDRVGIKPLYYVNTGKALVFASEIKALLADPTVKFEINPQSIDKCLTHLCLPGSDTLWKGIQKLEPGFSLAVKGSRLDVRQYWDLHFNGADQSRSLNQAADELYDLIERTVRSHMISDVPVGFLLSGGVDSTALLSCAAQQTNKKIKTFTVGFDRAGFADERQFARLAANRFGTEHHDISIEPRQLWDFLPELVWHLEEPISDPPAVSLHYVSKLAREHVKVLLSGEGGDEAFGGYGTYRNFVLLERAKLLAGPFKGVLAPVLDAIGRIRYGRKVGQFAPYINATFPHYYYSRAASPFSFLNQTKRELYTDSFYGSVAPEDSIAVVRNLTERVKDQPALNQILYIDTKTSLPDDLLVKADKMTMANSLELRVPFLDHHVLEFAANLPPKFKVRGLVTKRILKQTFKNRIPTEIISRKKAGFPIPIASWMKTDFKADVRDILLDERSVQRGYFNSESIEKLLRLNETTLPLDKEIFLLVTIELLHRRFLDQRNVAAASTAMAPAIYS